MTNIDILVAVGYSQNYLSVENVFFWGLRWVYIWWTEETNKYIQRKHEISKEPNEDITYDSLMFNPDEECENKVLAITWNTNPKFSREFCNHKKDIPSIFALLGILLLCHWGEHSKRCVKKVAVEVMVKTTNAKRYGKNTFTVHKRFLIFCVCVFMG